MIIHFFQPELFNRTEQKTNPFFDPLIDVCRKNNIPYRVFIAEKKASPNGYRNAAGNSWILVWPEILGFRLIKWFHLPSRLVWRSLGAVMNLLTFGRYRADICITVAGVHMEILQGIAPRARLVDLQHGVIYPYHTGYFDKTGKLLPGLTENPQREYWVYGQGFKDIFLNNSQNSCNYNFFKHKIFIVGNLLEQPPQNKNIATKNTIVFSLQFTDSLSRKQMEHLAHDTVFLLEQLETHKIINKYKIVLKHHPRYQNCYDLSFLIKKFPWISYSNASTIDLISSAIFHITAYSTTAFEYALAGIPTLFFYDKENPEGQEFLTALHYNAVKTFDDMLDLLNNNRSYKNAADNVRNWARYYYQSNNYQSIINAIQHIPS